MTSPDPNSGQGAAPSSWVGVGRAFNYGHSGGASTPPPWPLHRPQTGAFTVPSGAAEHPTVTETQGPDIDHTTANAEAPEPASQESVDSLHSKIDDLRASASAQASSGPGQGGQQGGQWQQSGTPKTPFATPVSAIQQQAEKHQSALESMVGARANLAQTRAGTAAQFARRQAQGSRVTPSGSGNAASDAYNDQSMAGALTGSGLFSASGNGSSAATWSRKRFLP